MNNPFDKTIARDTSLSSYRDMFSRFLLLVQIVGLVGGILLILFGISRGERSHLIGGIVLEVITAVLIPVRSRWFASDPRSAPPGTVVQKAPAVRVAQPAQTTTTPLASGRRPRILILNASLGGSSGNTAAAIEHLVKHLSPHADLARITLAAKPELAKMLPLLEASDGFVIATGTHWDSWSSHLQTFLEATTPYEGTALLLGKPVACLVTEHSVGGKSVLSRLQGVLVTLGCAIPPMSGLVISRACLSASQNASDDSSDFWCLEDLSTVAANLLAATQGSHSWTTWPVDRGDPHQRWLE